MDNLTTLMSAGVVPQNHTLSDDDIGVIHSLSDDEVYALTAYILAENKLIGADETMNAETLPKVKMPNRDNFIIRFPDRI